MSKRYNHILKYTGLFGGIQIFNIIIQLVKNKLVALIIGPQGIGLQDILNRATTLIYNLTNFGIGFSAVKVLSEAFEKNESEKITSTICLIRNRSILTGCFGTIICIILSPLISYLSFSTSYNYKYFLFLSPVILFLSVGGGETAILKAVRKLNQLAFNTFISTLICLIVAAPIYYFFKIRGVIPVIFLCGLLIFVCQIVITNKIYPWKKYYRSTKITGEVPMLKSGIAFMTAAVIDNFAGILIRNFIQDTGSLDEAGIYTSGFTQLYYLSTLIFSTTDSDYYPRLAGVGGNNEKMKFTACRQIEIFVLITAPILIFYSIILPYAVEIFYSKQFVKAIPLTICAIYSVFFKAITYPLNYFPLAKEDFSIFIIMELFYNFCVIVGVCAGYKYYGMYGAGIGLSMSAFIEAIALSIFYRAKYSFIHSRQTIYYTTVQLFLLSVTSVISFDNNQIRRIILISIIMTVSAIFSFVIIKKNTTFYKNIKAKINSKLNRHKTDEQ